MHQVGTESILDKIGIKYDPEKKYLGKNDKKLSKPLQPTFAL